MIRPYVIVNMAMSADGKTDSVERRGARISSPDDAARVDLLRARSDAVMVGGRTLLGEDPRLTVRDPAAVHARLAAGRTAQPLKIAVVTRVPPAGSPGGLPPSSRFLHEGGALVLISTTATTDGDTIAWLREQGAVVHVDASVRVDLAAALDRLAERGVGTVLVEGGGTLVAALAAADLVDELQLYVAPLLLGGAAAPTPMAGPGLPAASAIPMQLEEVSTDEAGGVRLRYRFGSRQGPPTYDTQTNPDPRSRS